MKISEFYSNLVEETAKSFLVSTAASFTKSFLKDNENGNNLFNVIKYVKSFRNGVEQAKYTAVFCLVTFSLYKTRIKANVGSILSVFLTSFLISLRNGKMFALKNGILSCLIGITGLFY